MYGIVQIYENRIASCWFFGANCHNDLYAMAEIKAILKTHAYIHIRARSCTQTRTHKHAYTYIDVYSVHYTHIHTHAEVSESAMEARQRWKRDCKAPKHQHTHHTAANQDIRSPKRYTMYVVPYKIANQ